MKHEKVLIIDFGNQYNQLMARRVRDLSVFCELKNYDIKIDEVKAYNPIGIIFTGGSDNGNKEVPAIVKEVLSLNIPVLGISYGADLIVRSLGGEVVNTGKNGYKANAVSIAKKSILFNEIAGGKAYIDEAASVKKLPEGFNVLAEAEKEIVAFGNESKNVYGIQFLPEEAETEFGMQLLKNFLYEICKVKGDWTMSKFVAEQIETLKEKIGDRKVLCAMSGGVDSAVSATLIHKAVGNQLTCVFVDHGLLRKYEADEVVDVFKNKLGLNLIKVDAGEKFLAKLKGVNDPEKKRKIIGEEFIRTFEREAKKIGAVDYLVQGTIYPDVIESGKDKATVIKSHHNVGGLPSVVDFKEIIEPLRDLFKDEVRKVGFELGLPRKVVMRQPFPGPGLGVRVMGEVTKEKLDTLRDADYIMRDEIAKAGLDEKIWQYFAIITSSPTVGVKNDVRTFENVIALRAITSVDAMTADWVRIPYDVLEKISRRITTEVEHANRVVYDITSKPPATIEWE